MAEQLKTPPTLFLPDIEDIEDERIKRVCEEYNKAIEEFVTAVYSDVSRLHERLTVEEGEEPEEGTEEGTWTMGVSFGGGTTGITYAANTGYYTKIGNIVTISGYVALTSKGTSTGIALITGLPFTVVDNNAGFATVALRLKNITFANQHQGFAYKNTTTIVLKEVIEAGATSDLTNTDFANDSSIIVNCTYRIEE